MIENIKQIKLKIIISGWAVFVSYVKFSGDYDLNCSQFLKLQVISMKLHFVQTSLRLRNHVSKLKSDENAISSKYKNLPEILKIFDKIFPFLQKFESFL